MNIDDKTFDMLQEVSRFEFEPEEREAHKKELGKTLDFFSGLKELDTTGVTEPDTPDAEIRLRPDEVANEARIAELLSNAPDSKGSYFRVPRTVEE